MGYYIQVPEDKGKAQQLADLHGATILSERPKAFDDVAVSLALICVVDNGTFEAAGLCDSAERFATFAASDNVGPPTAGEQDGMTVLNIRPKQQRPRIWVTMDKVLAHQLAGYTPR